MRARLWLVLVSVLVVTTTSEAAPPEPTVDDTRRPDLTANMRVAVHVYDQVGDLSSDDQRIALDVAREVFSTAAVDVAWTMCEPGMCLTPSAEALKLRLVRSPDRGESNSSVLGQALIDSRTHSGVLATIFVDRTGRLAHDLGIDHRTLLGRAIAHELGHLLLGTSTHSVGLMRERWSHGELQGTRRSDWKLDPLDVAAIRERLARSNSQIPTPNCQPTPTSNCQPTTNH
jgi:hypothetical protein